jgi:hypothetical protein
MLIPAQKADLEKSMGAFFMPKKSYWDTDPTNHWTAIF